MPILSVIIPTHNRQRYAIDAITTILENFPDTEVVVSDTSDTQEVATALQLWIESGRLIYSHSIEMLNVVQNFENGLNLATGDYLVFLGDDDCLGPQAEQIAHWAQLQGVDAVGCSLGAAYCWPDFRSKYFKDGYAAKLAISPYDASISIVDPLAELQFCLNNLGGGPANMPRAYLGMVSRALTRRIQSKYGSFFGGVSPDIYSAALLAAECAKFARIDFPFVLPGSSGASTSGQSASGGHKGKLRDNAHIGAFKDLVWDSAIPEFYSVQTVWSFSILKAVDKIANTKLKPSYPRLYAKCLLYHRQYFKETLFSIRYMTKKMGVLNMSWHIFVEVVKEVETRAMQIIQRVRHLKAPPNTEVVAHLPTIGEAYQKLLDHTKKSRKQLDL